MPGNDRFWRLTALALVAGVFYLGFSLRSLDSEHRPFTFLAQASGQLMAPATTSEGQDLIITQSVDGRTLYIWAFEKWDLDHIRLPVFRAEIPIEE